MNKVESYLSGSWSIPQLGYPRLPLDSEVFSAFLSVDISKNSIEIPICVASILKQAKKKGYTRIIFPLIDGEPWQGCRVVSCNTSNTIFRKFWEASIDGNRLAHVITPKGISYYGGRGIILNSRHELLMLTTAKVTFRENYITLSDPMCYLSYKVFEHSNELVEKNLIKVGLPMCSRGIYFTDENIVYPKVIIDNLDSFIVKPVRPTMDNATVEQFNKTIVDNYVIK